MPRAKPINLEALFIAGNPFDEADIDTADFDEDLPMQNPILTKSAALTGRLFCWCYFPIKPILLLSQREPCHFHALVPFMRRVISRTFGKLSAVLHILSEVV